MCSEVDCGVLRRPVGDEDAKKMQSFRMTL